MVLLVLPILIPLCAAAAGLLCWKRSRLQGWIGVAGAAAQFGVALALLRLVLRGGIQAVQIGGWPAPFGITLVADLLAAVLVALTGLLGLATAVYSLADIGPRHEAFGYHPLLQVLLAGICGAFLTGDIFNLYVWFEVMLVASFVLMALGGTRAQLRGAISYVVLNQISSMLFLTGVGLLYGTAGTLNLADLSRKLPEVPQPALLSALSVLFLVAFGIKSAVFPLFFWLPASYHTPPVAVSAIFAGLLTKVGVYAQIRVFSLLFLRDAEHLRALLLIIAGLTMVTGVLGAVAQVEFRRLLAFQLVSHMGYLMMGLGLFTRLSLAGTVFFLVHSAVAKTALFLVSGVVHRLRGTFDLRQLGGLYRDQPGLALLFLLPALSLAGLPPLSGFFAKLTLARAGLEVQRDAIVAVALGVSLLTLLSMMRLWLEVFWKPAPAAPRPEAPGGVGLLCAPTLVLSASVAALGLGAEPLLALCTRAADELLDPAGYARAVLGGGQ